MTAPAPVTHSTPSSEALLALVKQEYEVGVLADCKLWSTVPHDSYLVTARDRRYFLKLYRGGPLKHTEWRALPGILFEVDLLVHLARMGAPVAAPIEGKDGRFTMAVEAPEGIRHAVLYAYAEGKPLSLDEKASYLLGSGAAAIHDAASDFTSEHLGFCWDLRFLLDRWMSKIQPFLEHRPGDWDYLAGLAVRLRERIERLPAGALEWGVCHGDFHDGNAHSTGDAVTFFDFENCGMGWRSYDLAVFRWAAKLMGKDDAVWKSFLRGYTERRKLNEIDLRAVPLFVAARHIYLMGLQTAGALDGWWGYAWLDDGYFDRGLKFLREWETEQIAQR
jgi:Ser/Thr protein kinase RdoA (MazF antagonist)